MCGATVWVNIELWAVVLQSVSGGIINTLMLVLSKLVAGDLLPMVGRIREAGVTQF